MIVLPLSFQDLGVIGFSSTYVPFEGSVFRSYVFLVPFFLFIYFSFCLDPFSVDLALITMGPKEYAFGKGAWFMYFTI